MSASRSQDKVTRLSDSLDTSADSTKLVIAEDSDQDNSVVAGFSGEQTVGLSKRRHASSDSSLESFENLPIEKNNSAENIFNSPTRKFSAKSNSKNRRTARSQKGTPLKKLKLGSSESKITADQLEDRQNVRPTKTKPAKEKRQEKRNRKPSIEKTLSEVDSDLKNQAEERLAVANEERPNSSAERTEQSSTAKSLKKSRELTWSSLDESSDDATTNPVSGKSRPFKVTLPQTTKHSDSTDSDLSDDALADETLAIQSDDISENRSTKKISESSQISQNTSNAGSLSNDALKKGNKEIWKTPRSMKISKTKAIPSTIKTALRERSVSPVESIASSRGRRSLIRKNLNFDAGSDGSNTDDFFDETLSDFQPSSDSDNNIRNSTSSKKCSYFRKKAKISDSDSEENDHQNSKDVSKSSKKKRGPYKKRPKNDKNEDVKNNSQKFVSEEVSSDSEKETNSMSERLHEITNMGNTRKRREIERKEKRPRTRDKLNGTNAKAASLSVSAASQQNDHISETAEKESDDESISSSMSKKKLRRPWKIDLSDSMSSDVSDRTIQIETESVNWMKDEQPDLEFEKDKSVFDTIESSETDSDIEEVGEPVASGKNKGIRKFSSWQKNKGKLLQEIVGWLPFSRNSVSILIETLRDKILMKEYDRMDDLMKALMMKIAYKSKVRTAHGIEASMLAILVPVIFSQWSHLVEQTTICQFEKEDQLALRKYLVKNVIKMKEFNIEPFTSSLKMLTLEKANCKQSQSKILSDTIQDIMKVFSKTLQKSRRSGGEAISSEDHQPNVDHHVLCLKFQLDYLQVQTDKDAHALAEKIVAKVENSASHQRVGLQTLNSIINKLREHQIGDDLMDKWYAVLAETSYTGARKQERRRMKMKILQLEFKNNKNSDAGFSLAKEFAENGQVVKSLETFLDYWGRNREKCDYSLVVWEFLRSLLNEKEAFEWLKRYGAFGSPVQFRKILLKFTSVHPVEIISLKKEIRELF